MKRIFLILTVILAVKAGAATRVAMVGGSEDTVVGDVLDLATISLGQQNEIELLDRSAITRVLQEQNLSLSGVVDPNSAVRVGHLLSVDLFAVVNLVPQNITTNGVASQMVAGLVVFDAKTGARLWDATLSAGGVQKLAKSIASGVFLAQQKQAAIGLPTVCLMSVRNADLPRSLDSLCDSVGLLLERRLTASQGCVVLERERLDQVNKERSLPAGAEQQQLLASLVMMELECGRGPDGKGMSASARLTDNNGKLLNDLSVTNLNANADELAAALYQKISEAMKLKSGSATEDRVKESDQFRKTAQFFLSHGNLERGLRNLEAAFALNPDNLGLQRQLAVTLISYASAQTNLTSNLRIGDRGTEMFVEYARKASSTAKPDDRRGTYSFALVFHEWADYIKSFNADIINNLNLSPSEMAEAQQWLHKLYTRFCAFRVEFALPALAETALHHPDDSQYEARALFHDYTYVMVTQLWNNNGLASLLPEDWSEHWLATMQSFMNFLGRLSLERELAEISEINWALGHMFYPNILDKVRPVEREKAWRLMAGHSSVLVRAAGKLDELNAANEAAQQKNQSLPAVVQSYRLYIQDCLNDPAQSTNRLGCNLLYGIAAGSISGTEMVKFCDFMLQRNDLYPDIVSLTTSNLLSQTNRESAGQAVELCNRATALLRQPDVRYFGGTDTNQCLQDLAKQCVVAQKIFNGVTESPPPSLPSLPPAWREVRQLVDLTGAKKGLMKILRPVVQGRFVYAAGYGTDEAAGGQFLQLLQIPLHDGAVETLCRITVTNITPRVACVDEKNYYLGTSQGIFVFPKSGGMVDVLNQNRGLPSDEVTALDCLGGKLYIGLGESGYLVSYDLKQRRYEVLCSARRRELLSPFDNGSPLKIPILVADETKHRIIFLTDQGRGRAPGSLAGILQPAKESNTDVFPIICAKMRSGLWSYTPSNREFKCIRPRWPNANYYDIEWVGRISETQIAFVSQKSRGMALFDFMTDKHTLLAGSCVAIGLWFGVEATLQKHGMIVNPAFHSPPLMGNRVIDVNTASFVHDGWIWSAGWAYPGSTFSRISMDTGRKQELPSLREGDEKFIPGESFRLVGSDQALIGDKRGLWLVTFADDDAKTKSAQP